MSGIFGLIHLDEAPVERPDLEAMRAAMREWGPDGGNQWAGANAGLGSVVLHDTPEAVHEATPITSQHGFVLTAEARLDNRDDLCTEFGIPGSETRSLPDGGLLLRAYEKWGMEAPHHLVGDWSFAAWHPRERRLFLARDHFGATALYYFQDGRRFAFASSRNALFALGIPRQLNEFYLACGLVSWPAHHGGQTAELDVHRLPPAHTLTLRGGHVELAQYWRLEDTPPLRLRDRNEYVEGFLSAYDRAVRTRLRSEKTIGVTLSGGLDSGSVTALAARALRDRHRRLRAYTSVPVHDVSRTVDGDRFGDERHFARASAAFTDNVDLVEVSSEDVTPILGIRRALEIHHEPGHAAGNMFWIIGILAAAQRDGVTSLLTGQGGNATVSWMGIDHRRRIGRLVEARRWGRVAQRILYPLIPLPVIRRVRHIIHRDDLDWSHSAIHPSFARRINLSHAYIEGSGTVNNSEEWLSPLQQRFAVIKPGTSFLGSIWAENAAAFQLTILDPTFDKQLMEYVISIPDHEFLGPDGITRWMLRKSMKGIMPDEVRLNRRRGRQAADLGHRLVDSAAEVETALGEIEASPMGRDYLALDRMREVWESLQREVTQQTTHRAVTILTRGIMAGLYLVGLESSKPKA